jgi:hypothetical protein
MINLYMPVTDMEYQNVIHDCVLLDNIYDHWDCLHSIAASFVMKDFYKCLPSL